LPNRHDFQGIGPALQAGQVAFGDDEFVAVLDVQVFS
jgi:hypothetical protein